MISLILPGHNLPLRGARIGTQNIGLKAELLGIPYSINYNQRMHSQLRKYSTLEIPKRNGKVKRIADTFPQVTEQNEERSLKGGRAAL